MNKDRGSELKVFYSAIYKKYDLVNRLFTLGQDQQWRKVTAMKCVAHEPSQILDLCCGTGDLTMFLAKFSKPDTRIVGYDFNSEMLTTARSKIAMESIGSIEFMEGDVGQMPFENDTFDAITIGFGFRNLTYDNPDCQRNITEILRVLKPGGYFYILESGAPENKIIRFLFNLYVYLFLIPLGTIISGNYKAYKYLAQSSSRFYTNIEVIQLLALNYFDTKMIRKFLFGAADLFVSRKEQQG